MRVLKRCCYVQLDDNAVFFLAFSYYIFSSSISVQVASSRFKMKRKILLIGYKREPNAYCVSDTCKIWRFLFAQQHGRWTLLRNVEVFEKNEYFVILLTFRPVKLIWEKNPIKRTNFNLTFTYNVFSWKL